MDQRAWTECHVEAFTFFGGVPARLVPDNLKTGVDKPDLYNPKINRSYAELAAHYGCLIDPARALKPRDKEWVSYCTSWCCCGVNSPGELAALAFGQPGVGGVGRVEQRDVLVVGLVGGEQPGAAPGLDGGGMHAEAVGGLGEGEQAAGAEPVGVAGQVVAAA